jgi:hypothetical protein
MRIADNMCSAASNIRKSLAETGCECCNRTTRAASSGELTANACHCSEPAREDRMTLQTRMPAYAILATVALSGGPALGDDSPAPLAGADTDILVDIAPAPPDYCYRFGLRFWAKRTLFDKAGRCRCAVCGWHVSPPRRECWRVC